MKIHSINIPGYECVRLCNDQNAELEAIIAIHNTALGPALGGCRLYPYATKREAMEDALRLAKGMTYKTAMANLSLGGGKAVIIANPKTQKNELLFRAFGRFVETFNGIYITAKNLNTDSICMDWIHQETSHVVGSSTGSGDPSLMTAHGVFMAIKAAVKCKLGRNDLEGIKVAVQGIGYVGYYLCKELYEHHAIIIGCDKDESKINRVVDEFGVVKIPYDQIYKQQVDVFAPCALGAVINDKTLPLLQCKIIAGGANNQLYDEEKHGAMLCQHNIFYVPDYVANAGGVINVYVQEIQKLSVADALKITNNIYNTVINLFDICTQKNLTLLETANNIVKKRLRYGAR